MAQLSMAEKINELRKSPVRVNDLKGLGFGSDVSKEKIIEFALSQNSDLKDYDIATLATELSKRDDFYIEIGNKKITATELREDVIERLQNPISPDLSADWINRAKDVVYDMTDNDITATDILARETFLNDIGSRQAELYVMLGMYQTNSLPNASVMIARINDRIASLEKIKTVVKKATREPEQAMENQEISQTEQVKAKMYFGVLDYMLENRSVPDNMRVKLELNEGVGFSYLVSEEVYKNRSLTDKEKIIDRISQLRGRQQTNNVIKSNSSALRFDKDLYKQTLESQLVR